MHKRIQWFIERLVERIIPILGTSFSSTVETMHALGQAEQQSQLEEAARRYEADGKTEIAEMLRRRASQIPADNPAAQAIEIYGHIASDEERLPDQPHEDEPRRIPRLPMFGGKTSKTRRKRSASDEPKEHQD
jgi:hypothetical protein